ncbi:MAG: hypothetical protein MJ208_02730 [Bacilli bacterium]|nr:hypothetical protein [Bacilli bacterium]
MKLKLILIPFLLPCSFGIFSCEKKEDGNINDWVGEYEWVSNYCEHWHRYYDGSKKQIAESEEFKKDQDHFFIYSDKTWKILDSKGLGPKGTIRCYKDHINLLDFSMDYRIESTYDFKFHRETTTESERIFLRYYRDESEGRTTGDYDFDIRVIRLWLK